MSVTRKNNTVYMSDAIGITFHTVSAESVNYSEHYHDFVEFVYMLKGKCTHIVDGAEYLLKHGDMIMVNYGQSHTLVGDSVVEYVNIYIKPEYIDSALANKNNAFALLNLREFGEFKEIVDTARCKVSFSGAERELIENVLFHMKDEVNGKLPASSLALHSELNIILISFFRKTALPFGDTFDTISDNLLGYIRNNLDQKLTLSGITEKCPYNNSYFSRLFKKYTGMTFTEYLKTERIEKAKLLLVSTDDSVEDICVCVGYSDRTKFYKDFKTAVGETPTQYRKSKKQIQFYVK